MNNLTQEQKEVIKIAPLDNKAQRHYKLQYANIKGMLNMYKELSYKYRPDVSSIIYTGKGENRSEFGFYHNENSKALIELIIHYQIKSLLDLGSGPGVLLKLIRTSLLDYELTAVGYENEEVLVKDASLFSSKVILKDILTLGRKDVNKFEAVYFYEPFTSNFYLEGESVENPKAKQFVDVLAKVLKPNQLIFYQKAGRIGDYLRVNPKFELVIFHNNIEVWKLKSKN